MEGINFKEPKASKQKLITLGIVLSILIVFILVFSLWYNSTLNAKNSQNSATIAFTVQKGQGLQEISGNLQAKKLIKNHFVFELYLKFEGLSGKIQAGDYEIPQNLTMKELAQVITVGQTFSSRITIPEGWTNDQIGDYLAQKGICTKQAFLNAAKYNPDRDHYTFLSELKPGDSLEGFLYPDTYDLSKKADENEVIGKMLANFSLKFNSQLRDKVKTSGMTTKEAVILASIVEKEVSKTADRKMVAGIFENRLNAGMPLQSDVTVEYVLKTGRRILTLEETEADSPYNTYKHTGLPPGAISNPSMISIEAVLYPTPSDYAYFLAGKDGNTYYAVTLDQHEINKQKYLE